MLGRLTGTAFLLAASTLASAAAEPVQFMPMFSAKDWTVTLGVEGRVLPSYEGSGSFVLAPLPYFSMRRAGTPWHFRSPRDGASIGIIDTGRFAFGPTFKLRLPRNEGDDTDLRGLGDVGWTLEAGAFAEFWPSDWLRLRGELRQGIGGHHGLVSDLMADVVYQVVPQLTLSGGPRLTLASAAATSPYFSITPTQSAASGLPVYDAGGGLRAVGAGVQARYEWSPNWATHAFLEYERLTGDAASSPLVTTRGSRDQFQVGIGVTYSFDMKALW